jgi:hypothetical protein
MVLTGIPQIAAGASHNLPRPRRSWQAGSAVAAFGWGRGEPTPCRAPTNIVIAVIKTHLSPKDLATEAEILYRYGLQALSEYQAWLVTKELEEK